MIILLSLNLPVHDDSVPVGLFPKDGNRQMGLSEYSIPYFVYFSTLTK